MEAPLNERQKQVMDLLRCAGEVKVSDLKERFDVTDMTVRRDLEKLEDLGLIKRTFGGAILANQDISISERSVVMLEEKIRIGRCAAALVEDGDSILLDGGTTTLQVARHLPEHAHITAVTNAMNVAAELTLKKIPTIVLGGILLDTTNSMVGPIAVEALTKMAFDKCFLGATGVDIIHGFSNSNIHEAEIKRIAIQSSRKTCVVVDHSKFGEQLLFSFARFEHVHQIVTDRVPTGTLQNAAETLGIEIIVAD